MDPSGEEDNGSVFIKTNLLADYDQSGAIGISDLDLFISGWNNNISLNELGPLSEQSHGSDNINFLLQPDGKYDIEDLMTFIRIWNFCEDNNCLEQTSFLSSNSDSSDDLIFDYDGNILSLSINELASVCEYSITYDENVISLSKIQQDTADTFSRNQIILTKFENALNLKNIVTGTFGNLDTNNTSHAKISLPLSFKKKSDSFVTVSYTYVNNGKKFNGVKEFVLAPLPTEFSLSQNYPNPFNPLTNIEYSIAEVSNVSIKIYDISGKLVKELMNEVKNAGFHTIRWDSKNNLGKKVSSGLYLYKLQTDNFEQVRKMILMR